MHLIQGRYHWQDNYIRGNWQKPQQDFLPYARWIAIIEQLKEEHQDNHYNEWEKLLYQDWIAYKNNPYKSKPFIKNFEQFKRKHGFVHPRDKLGKKSDEIAKARAALKAMGLDNVIGSFQLTRNS